MEQITRAVVPPRSESAPAGRKQPWPWPTRTPASDLAKRVIQVHAVDGAGQVLTRRALAQQAAQVDIAALGDAIQQALGVRPGQEHRACAPSGIVAMETSSSSHLWTVMTKGEAFDPRHVSAKPGVPTPATPAAIAA